MEGMTLGNTLEEKREAYAILSKSSKKWGKVFAVIGAVLALVLGGVILSGTDSILLGLLITAILFVGIPFGYYWYGQIVYYGYLTIKVFLHEHDIDTGEAVGTIAGAAGTSVLVAYIFGGKKAVKTVSFMWLVILLIALAIGIFVGLYYYIKFHKEAIELGFWGDSKFKNMVKGLLNR